MVWPNVHNLIEEWWIFAFHRNFSKSNAFSENSIRTKFILHKIFFRMKILLGSKTSRMFFNLHSKMTLLCFQLIIITHGKLLMIVWQFLLNFSWSLAIFYNKMMTILTLRTSERDEWWRWGWSHFSFVLEVLDYKVLYIYIFIYLFIYLFMYKNGR